MIAHDMTSRNATTRRWSLYLKLIRFDKPIGTLLLVWPTLTACWLAAGGVPPWRVVLIFVLGTFLMRSAGCAINDVADRDFDRHVARTRQRVITAGLVAPREGLAIGVALTLMAGLLILPLNHLTWALSVLAVVIAATYPFFKRFFAIPQAYLGIAFSFGIPMAFAAIRNDVPWTAWALMLANLFWVMAYDTEYALVDIADDLKIGIRTSALTFGRHVNTMIGICYVAFLFAMGALGTMFAMGAAYYAGLLLAAGIASYHLWIIRHRDPTACFHAFLHNHKLGFVIFAGTVADFMMR
jgi:4-hydroxybenzoate polyprenyltransferase